ncbi:MAG TPA: cytochrome C oxidase subunit IV family protein [Bryobacteraceae bacterium]|nr:cytochrome C oxidase subunit IV family protein [Bryobacteraceae bacterium]
MASLNTHAAHAQAHDHEHHIHGGPKLYAGILGALLFLTVVTVGASMVDFGGGMINVVIAMLIASLKASLVALFFMHLRWEGKMNAIIFCSTLFFLGLFLIGCYTDNISRPPLEPTNMKVAPAAAGPQQGPRGGQQAPSVGHGQPGAASPSGGGPAIPGASPEGSYGGAATGTAPKPETTH